MKRIFIDTGAFLAREIRADQHHEAAMVLWDQLASSAVSLFSSEHVLDETASLLARRTSYAFASGWVEDALASGIQWLQTGSKDLSRSSGHMSKFADQGVSFTDCISFTLLKREKIRLVAGFDHHFTAAGFRLIPD